MVDATTKEGDVPAYPQSNPRNAFDEKGVPRNPAVSHPMDSLGFPDNDGDMASEPVYSEIEELDPLGQPTGKMILVRREGVNKPADTPDEALPEDQRSDISYRERYERDNPTAARADITEPAGQPVDKFGYYARRGAHIGAQDTGMNNPDNPERRPKSDRYLGVENPKPDGGDADVLYEPQPVGTEHPAKHRTAAEAQGSAATPPSEQGHLPENRLPEYDDTYKNHPVPGKDDVVITEKGEPVLTPGNPLPPEGETPPA